MGRAGNPHRIHRAVHETSAIATFKGPVNRSSFTTQRPPRLATSHDVRMLLKIFSPAIPQPQSTKHERRRNLNQREPGAHWQGPQTFTASRRLSEFAQTRGRVEGLVPLQMRPWFP